MAQESSVEIHCAKLHIDVSRSQIIYRLTYRCGEAIRKKTFCNIFLIESRITERPSERIFT